jgi:hypothetical protein
VIHTSIHRLVSCVIVCNNIVNRQVTSVANITNVCWLNDRDSSAGRGVNIPLRHSVRTVSSDHPAAIRWVLAEYLPTDKEARA